MLLNMQIVLFIIQRSNCVVDVEDDNDDANDDVVNAADDDDHDDDYGGNEEGTKNFGDNDEDQNMPSQ